MATSGSSILANWTLGDVNWLGHCQESAKVGIFWGQKKVPYEEFVDVLRFIAPNPFNYASRGTIVDWVDSFPRENISLVLREIRFECERDYCRSLIWEGNEDLAGIGVSYVAGWTRTVTDMVLDLRFIHHRDRLGDLLLHHTRVSVCPRPSTVRRTCRRREIPVMGRHTN